MIAHALLITIMLSTGEIATSPAFTFKDFNQCQERAYKIERDWFDREGVNLIKWRCLPIVPEVEEK